MAIPLPYPNLNFVPLDVLTAEELNHIVSNCTYIAANADSGSGGGGGGGGSSSVLDCWPVGSYYETSDANFNPNTAWGGTWVLDSSGRVTVSKGSGDFASVGSIGGSATTSHKHTTQGHALTASEIPSHYHFADDGNFVTSDTTYRVGKTPKNTSGLPSGDAYLVFAYAHGTTYSNMTTGYNAPGNGSHTHGDTTETEVSTVQPYVVVLRWHRIA